MPPTRKWARLPLQQIRDDKGYWHKIESYIRDHSEAEFSHGICPKCAEKLYPKINPYKSDEELDLINKGHKDEKK